MSLGENVGKIWKLMRDHPTCMMVSRDENGVMRARPMHAIVEEGASELWFYTRLSSGKSDEIGSDGEVCLCFASISETEFVSISGMATLVTDQARIAKNWNTFVDAWFPEGPEGGDAAMIRVEPDHGEYWDGDSSAILAALKMTLASHRDETPDLGENMKVTF
ncbi:pyridoxamine 5'-phosphate oxidase family protein [Pikeienuella piscinae]|uniref:Pyridoxamine 5'-phosphate oxidase family protein n=1 Tax=Pikeienuella piscinae TaxID=2748098 RepID=A0A7L5BV26_9RHOB|nr:pyridoxamine 5'-phosphate oxidase family protein [Pikeienuella piscinae]QIE54016.1 pyridoxamine 5'-phosphate oxidase family protein [Pikeienuella piscinae]